MYDAFDVIGMLLFRHPLTGLNCVFHKLRTVQMGTGVTEDFDAFVVMVAIRMGWPLQDAVYVKKKVVAQRPQLDMISPPDLARLKDKYWREIELYEYAKKRFQQQQNAIPGFEEALKYFKRLQEIYESQVKQEILHIDPRAQMFLSDQ